MKKSEYYINPMDFKDILTDYYHGQIDSNTIGEYLIKIAKGLSYTSNFINYSYKEDMIGDALVKMWNAVQYKKYDINSESNPFSYFTTIAYNAFINRIKKEKKQHETIQEYKEKMYAQNLNDEENGSLIYVKPILENDPDDESMDD